MFFGTKVNFVNIFPADAIITGFMVYPIREVKEDGDKTMVKCEPEMAQAYSLNAITENASQEWIADFKRKEDADNFAILIQSIYRAGVHSQQIQTVAEKNGWILFQSNSIYFDPKTGNTYFRDFNDPLHVDDIELSEWFSELLPEELHILEIYWRSRKAILTRDIGFCSIGDEFPYRWLGNEGFQVFYDGKWIDADEADYIQGNACWVRRNILKYGGKVIVGTLSIAPAEPLAFMWGGANGKTFLIHWDGEWREAENTDFTFIKPTDKI